MTVLGTIRSYPPKIWLLRAVVPALAFVISSSDALSQETATFAQEAKTIEALVKQDSPPNSLGMKFVNIPNSPIMFGTHEVTVKAFQAFIQETGYEWNYTPHFPQTGDHPVVNITLPDAIAFCEWYTQKERNEGRIQDNQSFRLPTQEEWAIAAGLAMARKTQTTTNELYDDQRAFPWGIEWPPPASSGNFNTAEIGIKDDGYLYTSPVGVFTPTKEGIYDVAGNVWEWTWDQSTDGTLKGVLRGGSWMYFRRESLLSSYEYKVPADLRAPSIGFRVVFENRQKTALFLAKLEEMRNKESQDKLKQIKPNNTLTPEEMEERRVALAKRTATEAAPKKQAIDPKTLKPAQADVIYANSQGAILRPLAGKVLIGEKETSVAEYEAYSKDAARPWTNRPTFNVTDEHPVMNVSWNDAKAYCEWLTKKEREYGLIPEGASYRLPTDAEWSIAVGLNQESGSTPEEKSGKNNTDYPWGNEWPPPPASANLDSQKITAYQERFAYTSPVGYFSPNSLHLYDMAGNVAEWCEDEWPSATDERVIRGSSWLNSTQESILSSTRQHLAKDAMRPQVGFRLALELP